MDPSAIQALFANSSARVLPRRQIVVYEGDKIESLYCIESGYVKVYSAIGEAEQRVIFICGPGDVFPIIGYLAGGIALYFYETMTDAKLRTVAADRFEHRLRGNFELGEALIRYSTSLNKQFLERINMLTVGSAKRKLTSLLVFLANKAGSATHQTVHGSGSELRRIDIPLTTQEIADMCGLTRETTSLQLNRLRRDGILSGSSYLVVDITKLEKVL